MIKLIPFTGNHKEALEKVMNNKSGTRKALLLGVKLYVESRYDNYETLKNNLENITNSVIDLTVPKDTKTQKYQKNALIHMYDSPEQYAKEYLKGIKHLLEEGILCPYCAITYAKQIDHFLPKSIFPEFSLYLPNMVVSCSDCNKVKDDISIDTSTNKRFVINPFHDHEIYSKEFLICKIIPPYEASKFEIEINNTLSPDKKEICEKHIITLKIEKKIKTLWRNYFDELFKRLEKAYDKKYINLEENEVIEKLKEIIKEEIDNKSINENLIHKSFFNACINNENLLRFWCNKFKAKHIKAQ